ncbi:MAG TPA: non-homologous end-joining DNA ligase [Solirubrobacteraceae bacterium]|jgi:bifunctional non-homologous end joining protein LigD|nr:non-homologous end-joining DNA ligase [Solirubrobacteraceae bacterium]
MNDPFAALSEQERDLLRPAPLPEWVDPMAATLTDERFDDPNWVFERKLDGVRCLAFKGADGGVRLLSRNRLSQNARFPELVTSLGDQPSEELVVDGEIVAFEGSRTSFSRLARRGREPVAVHLYLFDLVHLDGFDTRRLPLRTRKALLRRAVAFGDPLRYTPHRNREGRQLFRDACRKGWEGLIAKRADSPYVGKRSRDWLKLKCGNEQEFVIGGYTAPRGSREELGALLLGYFERGRLRYAGKVGTGFDRETLHDLARRLAPLRRPDSPFADDAAPARGTTWVEPRLVAQIGFSEWTRDGRLRHPRFLGLREDKEPREVVREKARSR